MVFETLGFFYVIKWNLESFHGFHQIKKIRHSDFNLIKIDLYIADVFQTTANRILTELDKNVFQEVK